MNLLGQHILHCSTSCCTSQSNGIRQISTPTYRKPLNWFWWNSKLRTTSRRPPTMQNLIRSNDVDGFQIATVKFSSFYSCLHNRCGHCIFFLWFLLLFSFFLVWSLQHMHRCSFRWSKCAQNKSKMAVGPDIEKKRNDKSPCPGSGLTDCHEIWCNDTRWTSPAYWLLKFPTFKIQDGGRPTSWKSNSHDMSTRVWPIDTKFSTVMHIEPPHHTVC